MPPKKIAAPPTQPVIPIEKDEDFPALAPPAPVQTAVGTGTMTVKKDRKKRKGRDGKEEAEKEIEVEQSKRIEEPNTVEEPKKVEEVNVKKPEEKPHVAIKTPATVILSSDKQKGKGKPPASSSEPSEVSTKRQGPLMMRIVSKDSLRSIPSTVSDTAESRPATPLINKPITGPALADMPLVVNKTKSALKKERLAAVREKERLEAEALAAARANDVQAPVVGRMKKKKEAKSSIRKPSEKATLGDAEDTASERPTSDTVSVADTTEAALPHTSRPMEPQHKTPNQLISELLLSDPSLRDYEMFKPHLPGLKWESIIPAEDLQLLRSTAANSPDASLPLPLLESHILVTPAGNVLRGLSPMQEEHYLRVEKEQKPKNGWITKECMDSLLKNSIPGFSTEGEGLLSIKELEAAVKEARKIAEGYEKKCEKLIKRNRKIVGLI